jgi:hypothetical protein
MRSIRVIVESLSRKLITLKEQLIDAMEKESDEGEAAFSLVLSSPAKEEALYLLYCSVR